MIRTKFTRDRRKKPEDQLKTKYYYRQGVLNVTQVDNSGLGLYFGTYVYIKKYSLQRSQFLIETADGTQTWTDMVVPIRPMVDGYELYYTCFELMVSNNYRTGQPVCYRTQNGFAFLRRGIQVCTEVYNMFLNGSLNVVGVPKGFNFALGYADNPLPMTELNLYNI